MGLDARVYCDCWEKGAVLSPPPNAELVVVDEAGMPQTREGVSGDDFFAFENWALTACPHQSFILLHKRLGNISLIAVIRQIVSLLRSDPAAHCPVLWNKVIYNGIHCGDYLATEEVEALSAELEALKLLAVPERVAPRKAALRPKLGSIVSRLLFSPISVSDCSGVYTYENYLMWWQNFLADMEALIEASRKVKKPLAF
ncbi:MAG TPA: hypothetical protein V6D17_10605 [Candidatus Obscuribacterales bacterium]